LLLNEEGVCNACIEYESKPSINWASRLKELERLVKSVKDLERDYDCLIPVSGGKDSTWQTVKCLELGLKPLAVTWKTPGRTTLGQQNLDNLISLGVDHIDFTINPKVEKYLTLRAFNEFGASAIPMHLAIFSIPMKVALNYSIPLIIYGENSAIEYGGNEKGIDTSKLDERWKDEHGNSEASHRGADSGLGPAGHPQPAGKPQDARPLHLRTLPSRGPKLPPSGQGRGPEPQEHALRGLRRRR
jgi:hypothetical protein